MEIFISDINDSKPSVYLIVVQDWKGPYSLEEAIKEADKIAKEHGGWK